MQTPSIAATRSQQGQAIYYSAEAYIPTLPQSAFSPDQHSSKASQYPFVSPHQPPLLQMPSFASPDPSAVSSDMYSAMTPSAGPTKNYSVIDPSGPGSMGTRNLYESQQRAYTGTGSTASAKYQRRPAMSMFPPTAASSHAVHIRRPSANSAIASTNQPYDQWVSVYVMFLEYVRLSQLARRFSIPIWPTLSISSNKMGYSAVATRQYIE